MLLDSGPLGGGSTSKAAGGVRAQFSDRVNIELAARSLEAFEHFPERTGQPISLHQPGYLFLIDSPVALAQFEDSIRLQRELGVPSRLVFVAEARRMSPLIAAEGSAGPACTRRPRTTIASSASPAASTGSSTRQDSRATGS